MSRQDRAAVDWLARDAAAVEVWDDGGLRRRWTAAALRRAASRARGVLERAGVRADAVVALLGREPEPLLAGLLGAWSLGAVALPLDPRLAPAEHATRLADAGCALAVVDDRATELPLPTHCLALDDRGDEAPLTAPADREALRLYTSGTTGRARGARLSHGALDASARGAVERLGVRGDDRWLAPIPLFHVGGLSVVLRALRSGSTAILPAAGADAWAVAAASGASLVSLVATQLARHLSTGAPPPSSLRGALIGGGPVPPVLRRRARAAGWTLAVTYGLTEAASQVSCTTWGAEGEDAGTPLDGVCVRVVEPDADGVGAIEVGGPTRMLGYAGEPPLDGWLATGDLGRLDRDGRLTPVSRRTDLIVSGGENVYPAEVEAALLADPRIAEACVLPLSDPEWGQRVAAVIVEREPTDDDSLRAGLADRLARFKLPRQIIRLNGLPRTATGKIARGHLRGHLHELADSPGGSPGEADKEKE